MSKNAIAKKAKNEVATINYGADAGVGVGKMSRSETIIPYVNLLQQMSPEVNEGTDKFLAGARPGFLLNSSTKELIPGKEGAIIVPLLKNHTFVEWIPRNKGGGFVDRHAPDSAFVLATKQANLRDEDNRLLTATGNHLVETFYLMALQLPTEDAVDGDVVCISFSRSKLGPWRQLMQPVYKYQSEFPIFAHRIRLRTKATVDKQGRPFFNFDPDFLVKIEDGKPRQNLEASLIQDPAQYDLAKRTFEFISQGLAEGTVKQGEEKPDEDDEAVEASANRPAGKAPF